MEKSGKRVGDKRGSLATLWRFDLHWNALVEVDDRQFTDSIQIETLGEAGKVAGDGDHTF